VRGKVSPKMVMNSFRKRSFMQPLGRPKHALKVPCIFSVLVGEWGGVYWRRIFFPVFLGSQYVPFTFPISSHPILNRFPKFSMYSPACSPEHLYLICFGKCCPPFTYIGGPKGRNSK